MKRFLVKRKKRLVGIFTIMITGWLFIGSSGSAAFSMLPGSGDVLVSFSLPVPQNADDAAYLELKQGSRFTPANLDVDLWVIEVLNIYCASCQYMRPKMNDLFAKIQADKQMKDRVKILAVGAGNHQWDIKGAEKSYDFPLLPDSDYTFHEQMGQPPTPFFIFARPYGQGRLVVVASHLGRFHDDDRLYSTVLDGLNRDITKMRTRTFIAPGMAEQAGAALTVPLSEAELLSKVSQSLTIDGTQAVQIEPVLLPGWDGIYTGRWGASGKRLFACVVARKIPCIDCHDVYYVYSFDTNGHFLKFVPISISKRGNEVWDEEEIDKIQERFQGRSLWSAVSFSVDLDAISGATISTELIYDSIGDTRLLIDALVQKGYMKPGN